MDLFTELLTTVLDDEDRWRELAKADPKYAMSQLVCSLALGEASRIADPVMIDRCLKKLREERRKLRDDKENKE